MADILNEFKYRVLYSSLNIIVLGGLIYLNLGLYVEFLWSYYSDYYQFVDFNWLVGVEELNTLSSPLPEQRRGDLQKIYAVKSELSNHILESGRAFKVAVVEPATTQSKCNNLPGGVLLECSDLTIACAAKTASTVDCEINVSVEISEFNNYFISIITCFTSQLPWAFDFAFTHHINQNTKSLIATQLSKIFSIFIFYPSILVLVYHSFCFISPAIIIQSRLKIIAGLQCAFLLFLIHLVLLPYMVTILSELAHESVDSEIFSSTSFDFISAWIYSFYFLVAIMCVGLLLYLYT